MREESMLLGKKNRFGSEDYTTVCIGNLIFVGIHCLCTGSPGIASVAARRNSCNSKSNSFFFFLPLSRRAVLLEQGYPDLNCFLVFRFLLNLSQYYSNNDCNETTEKRIFSCK